MFTLNENMSCVVHHWNRPNNKILWSSWPWCSQLNRACRENDVWIPRFSVRVYHGFLQAHIRTLSLFMHYFLPKFPKNGWLLNMTKASSQRSQFLWTLVILAKGSSQLQHKYSAATSSQHSHASARAHTHTLQHYIWGNIKQSRPYT